MTKIKFGTDGWRAIIADDYTVDNVKRVAEATGKWLQARGGTQIVIGHDCRFGGKLFVNTTARVLGAMGIKSLVAPDFVSTPMVSLGVVKTGADLGVVITASHNPPSYNGFKLKSSLGGPMVPSQIAEVEALIPEQCTFNDLPTIEQLKTQGLVEEVDLEELYYQHVLKHFDIDAIRVAGFKIAYDAMYGAGQRIVQRLLPNCVFLHCDYNPSFKGQAPEPILRNLQELAALIRNDDSIQLGFANDGDADRIGMFDATGEFVDSHHILLLLLLYMHHYKKQQGKVVITFSVTNKMVDLAKKFGLDYEVTPIGFKYIAEIMSREDVIVGGEESGGLAVKGHIPERDGVWIALMILEFMAKTGKTLSQLISEVYDLVGPFAFDRDDLHLPEEQKQAIIQRCESDPFEAFGPYKITRMEAIDGFKFWIGDDRWVLVRPSGTEPVLRVYAQAPTREEVRQLLDAAHAAMR